MRQFSELEKSIVKELSEWEKTIKNELVNNSMITFNSFINNLSKKYNSKLVILAGTGILIPSIEIQTSDESSINTYKQNNLMTRDVISIVNFLDYLMDNHLIYFVSRSNLMPAWLSPVELGQYEEFENVHVNKIEDKYFIKKVKHFYDKDIYLSQTLINYYNNDYKTDDEIRHNQNIKIANESLAESRRGLDISEKSLEESKKSIELSSVAVKDSKINIDLARTGVFIALMFGAIGVIFSWINSQNNDLKIDSEQFNIINSELQKIEKVETKLEKILEQINSKDTTITKIISLPITN